MKQQGHHQLDSQIVTILVSFHSGATVTFKKITEQQTGLIKISPKININW